MRMYTWELYKDGALIYKGDIQGALDITGLTLSGFKHVFQENRETRKGISIKKGEFRTLAYEYLVYDGDELILSGVLEDARKFLKVESTVLRQVNGYGVYIKNYKVIRRLDDINAIKERSFNSRRKTNKKYDYIKSHLKTYGNTIIKKVSEKELNKYLQDLKQEGIYAHYRHVTDKEIGDYWVIENDKK